MRIQSSDIDAPVTHSQARQMGRAIDRWRRARGLTQAQLMRTAQVSQGQLSRILAGRFCRASEAVHRLCRAAGLDVAQQLASADQDNGWAAVLERAVRRSWDGTPAHARELVRLLRVAKALKSPSAKSRAHR